MRYALLFGLMLAVACEDAPPSGARNLLAPTHPTFLNVGGQELLAFIDQGHDAVRLLDLTGGTYQWGTNPYFPRAVRLDDAVIDLAWSGEALLAMSLSGQVFEVPVELAPPVGLALPDLAAGAHPVGLVSLDAHMARLGSDCSLVAVSGAQPQAADGLDSCRRLGGSLVLAQADQGEVLARAAEAGLEVLGAAPVSPISAHAAADGGWWLVSAERRRLVKLDAQGEELLRFATPFDVMDLVESEDDEGALLAVVGLDTGVLYLRPDGGAVGPFGARSFTRPLALDGSADGFEVRRDEADLVGRDLLVVAAAALGSLTLTVAAVDGAPEQRTLTPADGERLPDESLAFVTLTKEAASCNGRLNAQGVVVVGDGDCPDGEGVEAVFTSSAWHVYPGTSLAPGQVFEAQQSLGAAAAGEDLVIDGHILTATQASPASGAVVSLRGQTGLGSLIFNDGWFSGVTAATAKTNYSETTQTWLWLTSPSEDAVVQLPLKSIEYYQFLIFR